MITVVSTGWKAPTKHKCLASVAEQIDVEREHVYVEASEQPHPAPKALENMSRVIRALPPDRIVALLDGDDWLAHPRALATVAETYAESPQLLATYGSYIHEDGRMGHCASYGEMPPRQTRQFLASHLKTFRAGLFQRIAPGDLMLEHGQDVAIMLPILEMAGPKRARFMPHILYVYCSRTSFEFGADIAKLAQERACVEALYRRPVYARLP